jgi:ABC-type Na+ efflux pump permease subunit
VTAQTVTAPLGATGPITSAISVGARTIRKFIRTPQLIILGFVQGAMFLLSFRYVFGGAISVGGMSYVDFLVPGYVTTMVLFVGGGAAVGVAEDVGHGFFDRLRSLPISRASIMAGRALADTLLVTWSLALVTALAAVRFGCVRAVCALWFRVRVGFHPDGAAGREHAGRDGDVDGGLPLQLRLERVHTDLDHATVAARVRR